jgi:hypothetical protein
MDIDILQCGVVENLRSAVSAVLAELLTSHTKSLLLLLLLVGHPLNWWFSPSAKLGSSLPLFLPAQILQTGPRRTIISDSTSRKDNAHSLRRRFHFSPTPPIHQSVKLLSELVL